MLRLRVAWAGFGALPGFYRHPYCRSSTAAARATKCGNQKRKRLVVRHCVHGFLLPADTSGYFTNNQPARRRGRKSGLHPAGSREGGYNVMLKAALRIACLTGVYPPRRRVRFCATEKAGATSCSIGKARFEHSHQHDFKAATPTSR